MKPLVKLETSENTTSVERETVNHKFSQTGNGQGRNLNQSNRRLTHIILH